MPAIDHVLLTRFNLPSAGIESRIRARSGWLRDRMALFEAYCLPSVAAQRNANLNWIIYLDPASPSWLKERMDALGSAGVCTPVYREEVPREALVGDLARVTGCGGDVLVTSNLDNDDGLAVDFAARLQAAVIDGARIALYFAEGLIRHDDELFRCRDTHNAFCSVSEPWDEPLTCWADWHNRLGDMMPVRVLDGEPGWLQVVHGGNVSNRIRGSRVGPERYARLFTTGIDGVRAPRALERVADQMWNLPLRTVRSGLRSSARRAIVDLFGKDALDRTKSALAGQVRMRHDATTGIPDGEGHWLNQRQKP
ncbi:glycosyltransferase [Sinomonas sp. B1-1]|uniref:glycosyltransferase n=1 Tax=Sinomonas sp. B1-1 TaxID=3141454 RepID=UPI003D27C4D8